MSKKKIIKNRDGLIVNTSIELRNKIKFYYTEKYFNIFMNKFKFSDNISYQAKNYLLRRFWALGTIGAIKGVEGNPLGEIIFVPWVMGGVYNPYDYPTKARAVNTRGVSYIPANELEMDEDIVIGYIQRNKKSVFSSIEALIDKIIDCEITLRNNLKAQKTPWLLGVSPENENKMAKLWDNLDSDEPKLFVSIEELNLAKALVSGAPYYLDKLQNEVLEIDSEIMTILGKNNVGILEKKEHLVVDEVNANNEVIQSNGDSFVDCMQEFFDRVNKAFGVAYSVELKDKIEMSEDKEEEEDNGI